MSTDRPRLLWSPEIVAAAPGPLVSVRLGPDGQPVGAMAAALIAAPPERIWALVSDLDRYPGRVPMIHKVRREGDRVHIFLRFKLSLFSVGFDFVAEVKVEGQRRLELIGISGEPRGIRLAFELEPHQGGQQTLLLGSGEFEIRSLGFLVKYFLRHHPEIELGIFPGVALGLIDAVRRAAAA